MIEIFNPKIATVWVLFACLLGVSAVASAGIPPVSGTARSGGAVTPPNLEFSAELGYVTDGVNPNAATSSTLIAFKVIYTDANNVAPTSINACVASVCRAMSRDVKASAPALRDGKYANGEQYIYATTLAAGAYTYFFDATNGKSATSIPATGTLSGLDISNLSIATDKLPSGVAGDAYAAFLVSGGGSAPMRWSAPDLPQSLDINVDTGLISGSLRKAGTYKFMATVTDATGVTFNKSFSLFVAAATPLVAVTFAPATNFDVGGEPTAEAVGDFNADGKLDLVVVNEASNNLAILLGDGSGSFNDPVYITVETNPDSVTVGDFNVDGRLDLAVANRISNNVAILLGDGAGSFEPPAYFPTGTSPSFVLARDVNADGKLDLVVANAGDNDIAILMGQGAGVFGPAQRHAVGSGPQSVAMGDFNGDGKIDLAVVNTDSHDISTLLGEGEGAYRPASNLAVGAEPRSLAIGDFNADGKLDIAVTNFASKNISILLGNGLGAFKLARNLPVGQGPSFIAIKDMNADGKQDLLVIHAESGKVAILLGEGTGTFSAATDVADGAGYVAIADFSADGKYDMAVANVGSGTVSMLLNTTYLAPSGFFTPATNFVVKAHAIFVASADFNIDGKLDLAVGIEHHNTVSLLLGSGTGSFAAATDFVVGGTTSFLAVGDVNLDGKPDLIVTTDTKTNTISILLGNGTGSFAAATYLSVGSTPQSVAVGDLNVDGKPDIVTANYGLNSAAVILGDGTGSFGVPTYYGVGNYPRFVAVADVNADGKPDLAVANHNTEDVSVLLGKEAGTFGAATSISIAPGDAPHAVAIGDFNEDGKLDFATANHKSDNVSVLLGNGNGSFATPSIVGKDWDPWSVATADLNGDGKLDLAAANSERNNVSVVRGDGNGAFGLPTFYPVGDFPRLVSIADFNRDGKSDLAVANSDRKISILLNTTPPPAVPSGLAVRAVSASQVDLSWLASVDKFLPVTGYQVMRNGELIATTMAKKLNDTGLKAATSYSYTIAACNAVGSCSAQSTEVLASTLNAPIDLLMEKLGSTSSIAPINGKFTLTDSVKNQGTAATTVSSTIAYYLSAEQTITQADKRIGSRLLPMLAARASNSEATVVTVPSDIQPGTYFMGAIVDVADTQPETIETNNSRVGAKITITAAPLVDLVETAILADATSVPLGGSVTLIDTVTNQGKTAMTVGSSRVTYYLSQDNVISAEDTRIGSRVLDTKLAAGASNTAMTSVTVPSGLKLGTYFVGALADSDNDQPESVETNNALTGMQISLILPPPVDLVVAALSTDAVAVTVGGNLSLTDNVSNVGSSDITVSGSTVAYYLSSDKTITAADFRIGSRLLPVLAAGSNDSSTVTVAVPGNLKPGTYFVGAIVDEGTMQQPEINETNNTLAGNSIAVASVALPSAYTILTEKAAKLRGSMGMALIHEGSQNDVSLQVSLPFAFPYFGVNRTVHIGSNSYLTFGRGGEEYAQLSCTQLGPAIHVGSTDNSWQRYYWIDNGNGSVRVRYEGTSIGVGIVGSPDIVWEATLYHDGKIELVVGVHNGLAGVSNITNGVADATCQEFKLEQNQSYVFTPGASGYVIALGASVIRE